MEEMNENDAAYDELERIILELSADLGSDESLSAHELVDDELSDYTLDEVVNECLDLEEIGYILGGPVPGPDEEQSYVIDGITVKGDKRLAELE